MKWSSGKKKKSVVLIKETNDVDKIINLFMNSYWSKIGILVKLMRKASVKWKKLNGIIESQRWEIDLALAGDEQLRRDQLLLHEQLSKQNRELREAHVKSLNEMEDLKRFQGSTFDAIARRRLVEDQDTILELTGKIQEL